MQWLTRSRLLSSKGVNEKVTTECARDVGARTEAAGSQQSGGRTDNLPTAESSSHIEGSLAIETIPS